MRVSTFVFTFIPFSCGILFGVLVIQLIVQLFFTFNESHNQLYNSTFNNTSAEQTNDVNEILNEKVKLFCWVMTYPKDKFKWKHVQRLWGKKCSKLIFMTSNSKSYKQENIEVVEVHSGNDSRRTLWRKVKNAFIYAYKNHFNEYDWFMKADLDSFLVMENYKRLLYQLDPKIPYLLGHRLLIKKANHGYMSGMSYVLSKEALKRFYNQIKFNKCAVYDLINEDVEIGKCLERNTIQVDTRDEKYLHTFFPADAEYALDPWTNQDWWYPDRQFYPINFGLNCCSSAPLGIHYIRLENLYLLNYLIYKVYPFGVDQRYNDSLPNKIDFKEVLLRSIGVQL